MTRRTLFRVLLVTAAAILCFRAFAQPASDDQVRNLPLGQVLWNFTPLLARGTLMTIFISVLSMALATALGLSLALIRIYGKRIFASIATTYIEFMRGTPLLVQLYFIYYGLPKIGIELGPLSAAIIGVGLNYAAYEAEIYRAGIMAIPRAQTEAALALGLTRWQAVRLVVLPQALRLVIPPVTNDFVALFKDTSIVSLVAITELTKAFNIAAQSAQSYRPTAYLEFAIVTALIYFALAYPLSKFARRLEERIHPHHDFAAQPM